MNLRHATVCSNCGKGLHEMARTPASPSRVLFHSSTDSSPATESKSPTAPRGPFEPVKKTANGLIEEPNSDGLVTRAPESGKELLADDDAQRLRQIVRFSQQRRRRGLVRLGTVGASIAIGLLGAALVHTHSKTPTAWPSSFIGTGAQRRITIPAGGSESAAIAQAVLESPPDMILQPDRHDDSGVPAAPEQSAAVELTHREPPSDDARGAETIAASRPAPHSNTLLRNATMRSASDRHAGAVLSVGPDSLIVHEVGPAAEEQKLHVSLTRKTLIIESQRNGAASGAHDAFTGKSISLAEVKEGDYVVVDARRHGTKLVAASITVTPRHGTPVIGPDLHHSASPTSAAAVAPSVQSQKQSAAPTAHATTPPQPLAPYDAKDPNSVIEWLLYPGGGRTR